MNVQLLPEKSSKKIISATVALGDRSRVKNIFACFSDVLKIKDSQNKSIFNKPSCMIGNAF